MNPRNRLVNFRVTDEELRRLKTASNLQHARCLSDFARSVILESSAEAADAPAGEWIAFSRRLARLESTVARLVNALESADIFGAKAER